MADNSIDFSIFKHSHNWKGGRYKSRGYWYIWKPGYFRSNKNGYIREHIFIFQEYYQCCLLKWGNVHHIDGNRGNNEISNLMGITLSKHRRLHSLGNKFHYKDKSKRFCLNCKSKTTYTNKKGHQSWHKTVGGFVCDKRPCRRKGR
jgi:HNH endonuclease